MERFNPKNRDLTTDCNENKSSQRLELSKDLGVTNGFYSHLNKNLAI